MACSDNKWHLSGYQGWYSEQALKTRGDHNKSGYKCKTFNAKLASETEKNLICVSNRNCIC